MKPAQVAKIARELLRFSKQKKKMREVIAVRYSEQIYKLRKQWEELGGWAIALYGASNLFS